MARTRPTGGGAKDRLTALPQKEAAARSRPRSRRFPQSCSTRTAPEGTREVGRSASGCGAVAVLMGRQTGATIPDAPTVRVRREAEGRAGGMGQSESGPRGKARPGHAQYPRRRWLHGYLSPKRDSHALTAPSVNGGSMPSASRCPRALPGAARGRMSDVPCSGRAVDSSRLPRLRVFTHCAVGPPLTASVGTVVASVRERLKHRISRLVRMDEALCLVSQIQRAGGSL